MKNAETRVEANSEELAAAQAAADSVGIFLDQLIKNACANPGLRQRTEQIVEAFHFGECNFKAELIYDTDGIASFHFFVLRPGKPPKAIFDCCPARKLDS